MLTSYLYRIAKPCAICIFLLFTLPLTFGSAQGPAPMPSADVKLPEDPAAVLAVVGQSRILMGDVAAKVDAQIQKAMAGAKQQFPEEEIKAARVGLTRQALVQAIQTKMMKECFLLDQVGTQPAEKRVEAGLMMEQRARAMFFENQIEKLKETHETQDLTELDNILRSKGTSLAAQQREFTDAMLGHMYMMSQVEKDPKVTIAEIKQYYDAHQEDYAHDAQARWEQLSALYANHESREATQKVVGEMGREVYFGSGKFDVVAKKKSEEPFADEGGLHDWTSQGALASKPIDDQVFSIPLNKMSDFIFDDLGVHIIRVLERKGAGITPLREVQEDIREILKKEKIAKSQRKMLEQMRTRVPVWSLFHRDLPGAKPLPESLPESMTDARSATPKVLR